MKMLSKIVARMGLTAMIAASALALTACDGGTTNDADGTASEDSSADASGGDGTSTGTDVEDNDTSTTDTATSDTIAPAGLSWVTIDGAPDGNADCTTSSAGADIDVVAVYRGGQLIGVGKPGTVTYKAGAAPKCPTWGKNGQCSYGTVDPACHNNPQDVAGGLTTKMYTTATPDTGYFGIGGGTVELQIGGCSASTTSVKDCDGNGPAVVMQSGDEVDVFEVDGSYKAGGGGAAAGIAADSCTCLAETYEVFVSAEPGANLVSLGVYTGSKGQIKVP